MLGSCLLSMCRSRMLVAASALLTVVANAGCHREPERIRQGIARRAEAIPDGQARVVPPMYSDEDAARLIERAAAVVPTGKTLAKRDVFRTLQIDPARLREHRSERSNLAVFETYQLSESFDLDWAAGTQDPIPLDRDDRRIFHVRVLPRKPISQDLEAVGLPSNQPLQTDGASPRR